MVVKLTKAKKFRVSQPILKNDLFKSLAKLKLSKKKARKKIEQKLTLITMGNVF